MNRSGNHSVQQQGVNQNGFSLIELLVVIAIIGILAAILFPVFAKARAKARETQCMTQMHDIGIAAKLYKEDYNAYPASLFGFAEVAGGALYAGSAANAQSMERLQYKPLFNGQRYLKDNVRFQCPVTQDKFAGSGPTIPAKYVTSAVYPVGSPNAGATYLFTPLMRHNMRKDGNSLYTSAIGQPVYFYKYDNYDVQPKPNGTLNGPDASGAYEVHYALDWTGVQGTADFAANPNQMKYGNNADEGHTVLTFCTEHVINASSDKVLVLTLGLQTKPVDKVAFYQKGPLNILK